MHSNAMPANKALTVNTVSIPFYSEDECSAADNKAKSGLIEGLSTASSSIGFVCVKRTVPESYK